MSVKLHLGIWSLPLHFSFVGKIDDSERLRPEELNQQNIEALVAENNLVFYSFCTLIL